MSKPFSWTWVVSCVCALAAIGSPVRAQVCEEDASAACIEDAGTDDAGPVLVGGNGKGDAGWAGGVPGSCSCSSNFEPDDEGNIHVCTGSVDEDTCASFTCELGLRRAVACSESEVRLCCEMPERELYSQLYDDCTHPRCEIGFRAQCAEFGGDIHPGPCQIPEDVVTDDEDDGGFCSAVPGTRTRSPALAWLLLASAVMFSRRRR